MIYFVFIDEICRVMKNLAITIFENCFPHLFQSIYWNEIKPIKRSFQRKGYMRNQHNPLLCEACHLGLCY